MFECEVIEKGILGAKKLCVKGDYSIKLPFTCADAIITDTIGLLHGDLLLAKGYIWKGASFITYDTENSFEATAVHDALYTILKIFDNNEFTRKQADKLFYKLLRKNGMCYLRARGWYRAVRTGGSFYV